MRQRAGKLTWSPSVNELRHPRNSDFPLAFVYNEDASLRPVLIQPGCSQSEILFKQKGKGPETQKTSLM